MRVRVKLFASFREAAGQREMELEVPLGLTVGQLLAKLGGAYPQLAPLIKATIAAINAEYVPLETRLQEGDEVAFIPPVSGGEGCS